MINQPTFATDENNDTYLDANGQITIFNGVPSVAQTLSNRLQLWTKEYIFNIYDGMPYEALFNNPYNQTLFYLYIKERTEATAYVTKVNSINFDFVRESRKLRVFINYDTTETKGEKLDVIIT